MYSKLKIMGKASGKLIGELPLDDSDTFINLMEFLRKKEFPIASSCWGDGVCKKCVLLLNGMETLSCQIKLSEINKIENIIEIDYL